MRKEERKIDNLHHGNLVGAARGGGSGVGVAHSAATKQRLQHCTSHLVTTAMAGGKAGKPDKCELRMAAEDGAE